MSSIILIIILLAVLTMNLKLKNKLYSASFLQTAIFLIGGISGLAIYIITNIDYGLSTLLIVFGCIIFLIIGDEFGQNAIIGKKASNFKNIPDIVIDIPYRVMVLMVGFSLFVLYYYFQHTQNIASHAGNKYGLEYMLTFAYKAAYDGMEYSSNTLLTQSIVIVQCIAYLCVYIEIHNIILCKSKFRLKYVLIPVIYLGMSILQTGRTNFIRFAIYIIVLVAFLYDYNGRLNARKVTKFFVITVLAIAGFLWIYRWVGILRHSNATEWSGLLIYSGEPLYALDNYLNNPNSLGSDGSETMVTVFGIINRLGFNLKVTDISLPGTRFGIFGTNIYTAFRRYIHDFTVLGAFVIQFLIGTFYGAFLRRARRSGNPFHVIMYATLFYPIIEAIFEERFLLSLCSLKTIYVLFYSYILFRIFIRKHLADRISDLA